MNLNDFVCKKCLNEQQQEQLEQDLENLAEIMAAYMYNEIFFIDEND